MIICACCSPASACRTVRSDGKPVVPQTTQNIIDQITPLPAGARLMILAPVVIDKKGAFEHIPEQYQRAGFARARVDGVVYALDEFPTLDKNYKHNIEIVVDRLVNNEESRTRWPKRGAGPGYRRRQGCGVSMPTPTKTRSYSLMYACPTTRTWRFRNWSRGPLALTARTAPARSVPAWAAAGSRPGAGHPQRPLTIAEGRHPPLQPHQYRRLVHEKAAGRGRALRL
jgi:hypothetical protein